MYVIMGSYAVKNEGKTKIVEDLLGVGVTKVANKLFDKFVSNYSYLTAKQIIDPYRKDFIYDAINMYRVELDGIPDTSFPVRQFRLVSLTTELYTKYNTKILEKRRRHGWNYLMDNDK